MSAREDHYSCTPPEQGKCHCPFRVLLVFDETDEGYAALTRCSDLSLALSAQVDVVSIVDAVGSNAACAGQLSDLGFTCLEELARRALGMAVDHLTNKGVNANGYVAFGRTVNAISRYAEALAPDFVIVGHRPRNTIPRWWRDRPVHADLAERLFGSTIVTVTLPSA
jgi:nucleotide-binding universal stress UspA family protein